MNRFVVGLFAFSLIFDTALTEVKTGSLAIIYFAGDKVIIASDSRAILSTGRTKFPPDDTYCKIAVLGNQMIFTSVHRLNSPGGGFVTPWNARTEAEKAFKFADSFKTASLTDKLAIVANTWSEAAKSHFTQLSIFAPKELDPDQGKMSRAAFITVSGGKFSYALIDVTYDGHTVGIDRPRLGAGQDTFAMGQVDLVPKYITRPPTQWHFSDLLLKTIDIRTLRMMKAVDMVAAYDPSGIVGGPVDAVELWQDGSVHWVARKSNCPENQS
jgi:hypothetical protein